MSKTVPITSFTDNSFSPTARANFRILGSLYATCPALSRGEGGGLQGDCPALVAFVFTTMQHHFTSFLEGEERAFFLVEESFFSGGGGFSFSLTIEVQGERLRVGASAGIHAELSSLGLC